MVKDQRKSLNRVKSLEGKERVREEVLRMLRFTKNNGITEGFHRKMKLI